MLKLIMKFIKTCLIAYISSSVCDRDVTSSCYQLSHSQCQTLEVDFSSGVVELLVLNMGKSLLCRFNGEGDF